ncbi:MAG: protein kinase, partial [Eubacterium sp.]|nr:protein kinase [Eubacterium sp.]
YIWSPDDKQGIIFEEYIRKNISDGRIGIHQLYDVVHILEQLTYCICSLHSLGLLHLDIKPSNFLVVYDRRTEISLGHVSLFDIDSIRMANDENHIIKVTEGFSAPELYVGKHDNRSDIYSIGAVMFSALVTGRDTEFSVYHESLFSKLKDIVETITIELQKSTNTVRQSMAETLLRLLKGCLNHNPNKRYPDCEALHEDIRRLKSLLYPYML